MKIKLPENPDEISSMAYDRELKEAIETSERGLAGRYISLAEFTKRAGVSKSTVSKWQERGKLVVEKINSQEVVKADNLLRMPEIRLDGKWDHQGGTIKTETKKILKKFALAGNISFTIDLGVRLALALFGLVSLDYVIPGIAKIANRHPQIRETFAKRARLLYLFAHEEYNLEPPPGEG